MCVVFRKFSGFLNVHIIRFTTSRQKSDFAGPVFFFFICVYLSVYVWACVQLPDDLNALWAYITFYGGECQLNLNKKVTHLVVKEPKGVSVCDWSLSGSTMDLHHQCSDVKTWMDVM